MTHESLLRSSGRAGVAAVSILLASFASAERVSAPAESGTVTTCESALHKLVATLESKRQLTGTSTRYDGVAVGAEWSKCRVPEQGRPWPRYAVFRSSDDVTVVVEKQLTKQEPPVLYGPFRSAYRK